LAVSLPGTSLHNLSAEQTFNPLFFADYQSKKTGSKYREFQNQGDQNVLLEALAAARLAHSGIRTLRLSYQSAKSKLFLQERARAHYEMMIHILYELWQSSSEQKYLEEAWKISEETKSLLLLEEIKATNVAFHNIPSAVLDTLKMLKQDLAFFEQSVLEQMETGDMDAARESQNSYLETGTQMKLYEQQIQTDYPQYRSIFQDLSTSPVHEIQARLNEQTVMIEYFTGDSTIYTFGLSADRVIWLKNKEPDLDLVVQSLLSESRDLEKIIDRPGEAISDYIKVSNRVYNYLFPQELLEVTKEAKKLIIVPDQSLAYISFEALNRTEEGDYLIEDHAITYAYSASLWYVQNVDATPVALEDFGGFAPSYEEISDSIPRDALAMLYRAGDLNLPGAQEEIKSIESRVSGEVWLDEQATEEAFKQHAPKYNLLHLALHGILDHKEPMKSKLLFHHGSNETGELNAYEIYNLPLKANLAVLSACNTATGALQSGEGIMSLARAFAYAGVPNLIASLWRTDDDASSKIMIKFYEGLSRKLTKDEDLRMAKLDFIHDQKTTTYLHPYFWSPYILIGDNSSHFKTPIAWYWLMAGAGVIVFLLYFGLRKKKTMA
ncbi:MAG: CHAT domain-containing protein, partial [Saprospiraceae bacterium]|nr:CHAT domain-containing protein [Saprospiraceae bacterium]